MSQTIDVLNQCVSRVLHPRRLTYCPLFFVTVLFQFVDEREAAQKLANVLAIRIVSLFGEELVCLL
jgi:hypothetical protein